MRRSLRRVLPGVVAASIALVAMGSEPESVATTPSGLGHESSSTTVVTPGAKGALTNCRPSDLSLSLGPNLAGAGNRSFVLVFENTGASACRLQGYPAVVGVDASGRKIGKTRHAPGDGSSDAQQGNVSLQPGQEAPSLLETVGVQLTAEPCVTYASVLVRAPKTSRFVRVPLRWTPGKGPMTDGFVACGTVFVDPVSAVTSPVVPTTTTPAPRVAASVKCQPSDLRLAVGPQVSEKTEQHSALLTVTNVGPGACFLFGFPGISLYDASGHLLPLSYEWHGDQMITSSAPERVDLAAGGEGFVLINKNVCVGPQAAAAATLHFIPPDSTESLALENPPGGLTACEPGDVGNTFDVSPIEPTESAAFASATLP